MVSGFRGSRRRRRQRLRMVASRRPGAAHDQKQHCARRGFLQDLQERVGRGLVEFLRPVDDGDAPAALGRGEAHEAADAADVVHRDLGAHALALFVVGELDGVEVGVRAGGDAAEGRVGWDQCQGIVGGRAGEQAAGEAVGQRGLADAVGAGDQPGVVHAPGAHGVEQRRLGGFVAEEERVCARVGRHGVVIAGGGAGQPRMTGAPRLRQQGGARRRRAFV